MNKRAQHVESHQKAEVSKKPSSTATPHDKISPSANIHGAASPSISHNRLSSASAIHDAHGLSTEHHAASKPSDTHTSHIAKPTASRSRHAKK